MPEKPHVLFLDDGNSVREPRLQALLDPHNVSLRLMHPENVEQEDLTACDMVVVDYFLEDWVERDESPSVARAPRDGLAVAGALRSRLLPPLSQRSEGSKTMRPVAFALWSAHLSEATFGLPSAVRAHVFARENNLEWAFDRQAITSGTAVAKVVDLATAVTSLPESWPGRDGGDAAVETLAKLLELPDEAWADDALTAVLACCPPVFELSQRSHGLVLLRWLLHRVLPYPTFLVDRDYLRARLRLDALPEHADAPLWRALEDVRYRGLLHGFDGPRWWRAGVEHWLWDLTEGRSGRPASVQAAAVAMGGIAERTWRQPVIIYDARLQRVGESVEIDAAVRIRPEDWPPYADAAYARREEAIVDPALSAMVDPADRDLLDEVADQDGER